MAVAVDAELSEPPPSSLVVATGESGRCVRGEDVNDGPAVCLYECVLIEQDTVVERARCQLIVAVAYMHADQAVKPDSPFCFMSGDARFALAVRVTNACSAALLARLPASPLRRPLACSCPLSPGSSLLPFFLLFRGQSSDEDACTMASSYESVQTTQWMSV